jgi:hypothetical protein
MAASKLTKRWAALAAGIVVLSALTVPFSTTTQAAPASFADPAFSLLWNVTDKPVDAGVVSRSWMWGPTGFYTTYEPYLQGPGGQHLVQYFDKSRMEINNPSGDRNSPWFVTNGLLVVEMISGRIQAGDQQFIQASPANLPVAGDPDTYPDTPTYASLTGVASINGGNRAPVRTGQNIVEGLGRSGNIALLNNLAQFSKYAVYEPTLGHNIPDVFWSFLNQQGPIYQNGHYVNGPLMNWVYVMGYPITEPYWIRIKAAGQERWVLMQAFQRRILTYSPFNPNGWKVEMGNVGRSYYDWRYTPTPPAPTPAPPTPTPVPAPGASIAINPTRGDARGPVQVTGANYPANSTVTISAVNTGANYARGLTTVRVNASGAFNTTVNIPVDAAKLGLVTIVATANGTSVSASQVYIVKAIFTDYSEVPTGGGLHVYGVGMPAGQNIRFAVHLGRTITWVGNARVANDRTFDTVINIGNIPIGSSISIIGQTDDGYRVESNALRVIAQPQLTITPTRGSVSTIVTVHGTKWPAGRSLLVGKRSADNRTDVWLRNAVTTDANGSFTAQVSIGRDYANARQVLFEALDTTNGVLVQATFTVTR